MWGFEANSKVRRRAQTRGYPTEEFTDSATIPVPCPEIELTLDQIYEEIEMPPLRIGEPEVEPEADEYAIET